MTAWQRLTSSWRTSSLPQIFLISSTDCTDFTDLIFCVICVICWLLSSNDTNCTKLLVTLVSFVVYWTADNAERHRNFFLVPLLNHYIFLRVLRILWFSSSSSGTGGATGTNVREIERKRIIREINNSRIWCYPLAKIIICCWINFCPRSPKPMNSYNSLIIIDIT